MGERELSGTPGRHRPLPVVFGKHASSETRRSILSNASLRDPPDSTSSLVYARNSTHSPGRVPASWHSGYVCYLTGIIVKKMVLLLKTARAGHPPPPSRADRPATAHYRTHRVSPAPRTPRRRAWGQRQPHKPVFSRFSPFYQNYPAA